MTDEITLEERLAKELAGRPLGCTDDIAGEDGEDDETLAELEHMRDVADMDVLAQHIIDCAEVINRLLTYPKDARRAVLYDNLHDSLATFEESAPDYPDPDDDADETDGGEAVDPNTGEIK